MENRKVGRVGARWATMSKAERVKVVLALPVILLGIGWIAYQILSGVDWSGPAKPPDTPGARIVAEVNGKLVERAEFRDAGLDVISETPLRFKVVGAVESRKALEDLRAYLKEIRPDMDYEMDVSVLSP
jgi:hypothetical protein